MSTLFEEAVKAAKAEGFIPWGDTYAEVARGIGQRGIVDGVADHLLGRYIQKGIVERRIVDGDVHRYNYVRPLLESAADFSARLRRDQLALVDLDWAAPGYLARGYDGCPLLIARWDGRVAPAPPFTWADVHLYIRARQAEAALRGLP